jgi:hypothetical protein
MSILADRARLALVSRVHSQAQWPRRWRQQVWRAHGDGAGAVLFADHSVLTVLYAKKIVQEVQAADVDY